MTKTFTTAAAASGLTAAVLAGVLLSGGAAGAGNPPARESKDVLMWASPAALTVTGLPCLPTSITVSMLNTTAEGTFGEATLAEDGPVDLTDTIFQTYLLENLPTAQPVSKTFGVTVPRDTAPGTYDVTVTSGQQKQVVPVTVATPDEAATGGNLAYGQQGIASSTHGNFSVCGGVDGDKDQSHWDTYTGWNDASKSVFPDWYGVEWPSEQTIERVEVTTKAPVLSDGLEDFDVQVRDGEEWRTVASVVDNTDLTRVVTFPAERTDAVRILVSLGRNTYSRIVELEVYGQQ